MYMYIYIYMYKEFKRGGRRGDGRGAGNGGQRRQAIRRANILYAGSAISSTTHVSKIN